MTVQSVVCPDPGSVLAHLPGSTCIQAGGGMISRGAIGVNSNNCSVRYGVFTREPGHGACLLIGSGEHAGDEELNESVGVVIGVAGHSDTEVPDALHQVVCVDWCDVSGAAMFERGLEE
ncbi:hypothetical protein EV641_10748 [Rhodococcus sp. SMB37]|nr:hypothetical protein EV641_10748 [Rhodococcus sp. SMB37]